MRQPPEFFGEEDLDLIYIAKKLKDAVRLESALDAAGLDYAVETDRYQGGVVFRSERVGAFFYLRPAQVEAARTILRNLGLRGVDQDLV